MYLLSWFGSIPSVGDTSLFPNPFLNLYSYIAYASARMEPVFCVLGESAGVAAAQALTNEQSVQAISIPQLQKRLSERGQIIEWTP